MNIKKLWLAITAVLIVAALTIGIIIGRNSVTPVDPGTDPGTVIVDPSTDPGKDPGTVVVDPVVDPGQETQIDEDGIYDSKEDVALYLHVYNKLPSNYVTKTEARKAGWDGGSLEPYFPNGCIGGDTFGNREGLLPSAKGRKYYECDIDTMGKKSRGQKRIVFSNDGLIYYTDDHYESFTLLYGEE